MKHIRQNPIIERGWIRFVGTRGFFFCFAAVTVAAISAGFLRRGPAILAFPMLAWSPFLFLISLHAAAHAINESRNPGASTSPAPTPAQSACSIGFGLVVIAVYSSMFLRSSSDNLALPPLFYWLPLLFIILVMASHILNLARNPWSSILRRAIPPVSWFFIAIYLPICALWMLFSIKTPHS